MEHLRELANSDSLLVDANVIEKLEQEQIDDKYILRWTAIIDQDTSLILDRNLRARGTKTGFYGFQYLKPIESLKDIEKYKK
ncbi:MAG: hypothetical protein KBH03_04070 [Paludibacteraceae bacterium]|nr:hypothetical protein [Paludibacteraceae bacterium]